MDDAAGKLEMTEGGVAAPETPPAAAAAAPAAAGGAPTAPPPTGKRPPTPCPPEMRPYMVNGAGRVMAIPFSAVALAVNNKTIRDAAQEHKTEMGEAFVSVAEAFGWITAEGLDHRAIAVLGAIGCFDGVITACLDRPRVPWYGKEARQLEKGGNQVKPETAAAAAENTDGEEGVGADE